MTSRCHLGEPSVIYLSSSILLPCNLLSPIICSFKTCAPIFCILGYSIDIDFILDSVATSIT